MKRRTLVFAGAVLFAAGYALAAETEKNLCQTYSSLADVILGAKQSEANLVRAIVTGHRKAAQAAFDAGRWEDAAAEMALFANEGDNAVGGIRKRLLEGGHHHNAEGEAKGIFEAGYVIVTRKGKQDALTAVEALQGAKDDAGRNAAWRAFEAAAESVLAK